MPQTAEPLTVRMARWRRRVVSFALAIFAAAWIAVLGLGRHAVVSPSTASAAGSPATSTSTITPSTSAGSSTSTGSSSADSGTSGAGSSQSGQSSSSANAPLTTSQS